MNSIKRQMLEQMQASKEYRHGFVKEAIRSRIVGQIAALRKEGGWDLKTFAAHIEKKVSWAYRLEDPNSAPPTIPSLLKVAEAFDIGLDVRFRRFSELLEDIAALGPDSFRVPSFDEEWKAQSFSRSRKRKVRSRCHKPVAKIPARTKSYVGEGKALIGAGAPHPLALAS
jgi:transcriptional regulator with XRE-family HTH domain